MRFLSVDDESLAQKVLICTNSQLQDYKFKSNNSLQALTCMQLEIEHIEIGEYMDLF